MKKVSSENLLLASLAILVIFEIVIKKEKTSKAARFSASEGGVQPSFEMVTRSIT